LKSFSAIFSSSPMPSSKASSFFRRTAGATIATQNQRRRNEKAQANRAIEENGRIPIRHEHGAPKIFLKHRAQDETEDQWSRLALELREYVTQHTDGCAEVNVHRAVVKAVMPNAANMMIDGNSQRYGMVKSFTHRPTKGRFRIRPERKKRRQQ